MGKILYNTILQIYRGGLYFATFFNAKAKLFVAGRKHLFEHVAQAFRDNQSEVAWFHCASLGEFEQGRPVMEAYKNAFPEHKILLTFFSPSGFEVRKHYAGADYIFYLPWDTNDNAEKWVRMVQPSIVFFVKYEFWHHYSKAIVQAGIPLVSFSAIFRPQQLYFKWYGGFNREILKRFTHIFVQDEGSKKLLEGIGIVQVTVAGDTRFDRVWEIAQAHHAIAAVDKFKQDKKLMVIGSSWPEDEAVLIPIINQFTNLKFIIAPHEIHAPSLDNLQKNLTRPSGRFSQWNDKTSGAWDVLVIDNVGMLSTLYRYASYAYIGGGFGKGLHNILEAATFGALIFFGNKSYSNFKEARDLIRLEGAFAIADAANLAALLTDFETDEQKQLKSSAISEDYVKSNIGATEKIIEFCRQTIK